MSNDRKSEPCCSISYLAELQVAPSEAARSNLVFSWLCDDSHRRAFLAEMQQKQPVLRLRSCVPVDSATQQVEPWVYLLSSKGQIETALTRCSNSVYRGIGSGSFVLGMDLGAEHNSKRKYLIDAFKGHSLPFQKLDDEIQMLAIYSCRQAMVWAMKKETFDLVPDVAEQATLRFIAAYFGFTDADHVLLQETLRPIFESMIFQMFARHFVNAPQVPAAAKLAMGKLIERIAELLREASDPTLVNEVFSIIESSTTSCQAFKALAEDIAKLEPAVGETAGHYARTVHEPGLPQRTVTFLDEALNFRKVRVGISRLAMQMPEDVLERFRTLTEMIIKRKEAADDRLVPRRWLRNGTVPLWDNTDGDYYFRKTFIERIAARCGDNSAQELAVNVVGSIAGVIGNVIASVAITINHFFEQPVADIDAARIKAIPAADGTQATMEQLIASARSLGQLVNDALRTHSPAPFLPRTTLPDTKLEYQGKRLPAGAQLLLPVDLLEQPNSEHIFGHPNADQSSHRCIGEHIARPLIQHIVRSVVALPGLATVQSKTTPARLEKKWGYICKSLLLSYQRERHLVQRPLNVVMTVKHPSAEHAEKLKLIIKYGAPQIEQLLSRSGMVHFARFVFLNGDTQLALMTVYDGTFDTYIRHFATAAGPLFDMIFEHIEDPPQMPVRNHPTKFVEHIARYDQPSVQSYFFSARPTQRASGATTHVNVR